MDKIKLVFLATPDIAINSFNFFLNSPDYEVMALISQPSKTKGRGNHVCDCNLVKIAHEKNIDVFQPERISRDEDLIKHLTDLKPDFFVTFAFGQILSQKVIDIARIATINLHASLLPQYRGANPIAQAIIDGQKVTGITTMKTVLELDAGDICLQDKIEITPNMNVVELMEIISDKSPNLLDKTLKGLMDNSLKSIPQDSSKATFTKKISKDEKIINWNSEAQILHNKIRGMYQINTNHTTFNEKIVKILKTEISNLKGNFGNVLAIEKDGIIVGCLDNSIKIITVKPEGKGEMNASDWARGARIKIGDKFK